MGIMVITALPAVTQTSLAVVCCVEQHNKKSLSLFHIDVRPICWQRTTWILSTFQSVNTTFTQLRKNQIWYCTVIIKIFARKYITQIFSGNRMDSNKESICLFIFWGQVIELTVGNSMSNCSTVFHKKPYLHYMILF
jgi:hypothetical protein